MDAEKLTENDKYFEDFEVKGYFSHFRGKLVTEKEAAMLCDMVMNATSVQPDNCIKHEYIEDRESHVDKSLVFSIATVSIVLGLAYQDTGNQVVLELGINNIKLIKPVFPGTSLYAYTEIMEKTDHQDDAGIIVFRHYGFDSNKDLVCLCDRSVLIRKRAFDKLSAVK